MILENADTADWNAIQWIARRARLWLVVLATALTGLPVLQAQTAEKPAAFSDFDSWWKEYAAVTSTERPGLVKRGTALAKLRRTAMLALIESDPAKAIEWAFDEEYHTALPKAIRELVEVHVRGLAQLTVLEKKDGSVSRKVILDGETWKAYLYGARLDLRSREEIPIHGVALEGRIAVDGSPLERFPNRETLLNVLRQSDGKKTCPICNEPGTIPTAVGDILLWFDTDEHLITCEKALIEKEMHPEVEE